MDTGKDRQKLDQTCPEDGKLSAMLLNFPVSGWVA